MKEAITKFNLPDVTFLKSGKVREVYDLDDSLLFIASDRISAFDCILPDGIPDKGEILTQISLFWFDLLKDTIQNHLITANFSEFPSNLIKYKELNQRSMIVKKTKVIPIECVVRGYLSGSGWKDYQKSQSICGIKLPAGLQESEKLPEPIFTPTTKEDVGHDMPISFEETVDRVGRETSEFLKEKSITIYKKAADYALTKGIIIADTKFEFGVLGNEIILIDEVLTPDSSRFWPQDQHKLGISPTSFDKQFVRDYLETIAWDKKPPAPNLPKEVIHKTSEKYLEAYKRLVGKDII